MTLHRPTPLSTLLLSFLVALPAWAGLDKDAKKWLEGVAPLILPDEEKLYEALKDKDDQQEFQKIFWARRDPDLATPENEYQPEYEKAKAEADQRFKVIGNQGSATDCGRVFILLGEPTEVKARPAADGDTARAQLGAGGRNPEIWRYAGGRFAGGEAAIAFDSACMGPKMDQFRKQMDRVAAEKVVHPNIDYRFDKDGHLVKLADMLPKPSPAQALLKAPRHDFEVVAQPAFLKAQGGGTALLGLIRGDAAGLPVEGSDTAKILRVIVCAQAEDADGRAAAFTDQEADAVVTDDGGFLASFRMGLKPGKYTLKVGALEPKTGKGSLVEMPLEVPDFNGGQLSSTMFLVDNVEEKASTEPTDAYSAFAFGSARITPHFGATYSRTQALWFFYQYYDAQAEETSGKASVTTGATLYRGSAPLAKSPEQTFDTVIGGTAVGPISLSGYFPGRYKVEIKVADAVAKKDLVQSLPFDLAK
jgi:GWxTD domain-containing protein